MPHQPFEDPISFDPARVREAIAACRIRLGEMEAERKVLLQRVAVYEQLLELSGAASEAQSLAAMSESLRRPGAERRPTIAEAAAQLIREQSPENGLTTADLFLLLPLNGFSIGGQNPRATLITSLKRSPLVYESPVERGRWYLVPGVGSVYRQAVDRSRSEPEGGGS